jgi:hypothetical protein
MQDVTDNDPIRSQSSIHEVKKKWLFFLAELECYRVVKY